MQQEKQVRQYVIQDLIAEGGMGAVWRAWDSRRNAFVAIKVVSNDLLADPNFKTRFLDEVHRHARLNHPNIVPVLDAFEQEGQSYCVMQLIEGVSLGALLKTKVEGRLEMGEARPIMSDILSALDYAHQHGIIHRDIKPSNVLLDREGRAYLIDFGIALAIGEQRRTRTGLAVGTPLYMSPRNTRWMFWPITKWFPMTRTGRCPIRSGSRWMPNCAKPRPAWTACRLSMVWKPLPASKSSVAPCVVFGSLKANWAGRFGTLGNLWNSCRPVARRSRDGFRCKAPVLNQWSN